MDRRTVTLADLVAGRLPDDLTAIRWPDGTVECRANVVAPDYLTRLSESGRATPGAGAVLTDPKAACDVCADKCG